MITQLTATQALQDLTQMSPWESAVLTQSWLEECGGKDDEALARHPMSPYFVTRYHRTRSGTAAAPHKIHPAARDEALSRNAAVRFELSASSEGVIPRHTVPADGPPTSGFIVPLVVAKESPPVHPLQLCQQGLGAVQDRLEELRRGRESLYADLQMEIETLLEEQNKLKPAGYDEAINTLRALPNDVDPAIRQRLLARINLGDKRQAFKDINGKIAALLRAREQAIIAIIRQEESLITYAVQHATTLAETNPRATFEFLALAANEFREGAGLDAEEIDTLKRLLAQNHNIKPELYEIADRRALLLQSMTLPPEQKGRGVFFNTEAQLRKLGLSHLKLPDRIPLPSRLDVEGDMTSEKAGFVRVYDMGLRTALSFADSGEVNDDDDAIVILTHGVGTLNSTLSTLVIWQATLMNHYGGAASGHASKKRKLSAIGYAEPGHEFGPTDPRFFKAKTPAIDLTSLAPELHVFFEALEDPSFSIDYMRAVAQRYSFYQTETQPKAVIVGGRSAGGWLARVLRQQDPDLGGPDGALAMSAYPYHSLFWSFYAWYLLTYVSPVRDQRNVTGLDWFVRLGNSFADLNDQKVTGAMPSLNLAGGRDVDYPHSLPESLDPQSPEAQRWLEDAVERINLYSQIRYGKAIDKAGLLSRFGGFFPMLNHVVAAAAQTQGMDVAAYWQKIRDAEMGLADFWSRDAERDDKSTLHFDPHAFHNLLDTEANSPDSVAGAKEAMVSFIRQVVTRSRHPHK